MLGFSSVTSRWGRDVLSLTDGVEGKWKMLFLCLLSEKRPNYYHKPYTEYISKCYFQLESHVIVTFYFNIINFSEGGTVVL